MADLTLETAMTIRRALRDMQEMWDELSRRKLSPALMRRYSDSLVVLERDFLARIPDGVSESRRQESDHGENPR